MKIEYTLTPRLRTYLKEPFGILIAGTVEKTMAALKEKMVKEKPAYIISVGDTVSQNMHEKGINPLITIIDGISLRSQIMPKQPLVDKTIYAKNPQGTITDEAIQAIKIALETNTHTHIVVDGEEDLLTLVAVLYASDNSFVIYGQPHTGIVVVKVTSEKKEKVKEFLNEMKASKS